MLLAVALGKQQVGEPLCPEQCPFTSGRPSLVAPFTLRMSSWDPISLQERDRLRNQFGTKFG
jgi:hypothetical protein